MECIWAGGRATAEQVREALQPRRALKDSTVRTLLRRLEEKGYLAHDLDGRTFVYRAVEPPRSLAVRAVRQIIDRFCAGSVEQLLVGMVDEKVIEARELERLAGKVRRRQS